MEKQKLKEMSKSELEINLMDNKEAMMNLRFQKSLGQLEHPLEIRNIRRDAISDFRELLKEKEISEDESHRAEDNIQKITDQHINLIEKSLSEKESSLLEI